MECQEFFLFDAVVSIRERKALHLYPPHLELGRPPDVYYGGKEGDLQG
jgi:hypothetical protein